LSLLAAITLEALPATAKDLWVIKDGVLNKDALTPAATSSGKGHVYCGGQTVDGLHVVTRHVGGRANYARFITAKSAIGDCELRVVFSCTARSGKWVCPKINVADRGYLCFSRDGSQVLLRTDRAARAALPLKGFAAPCPANVFDGKLHSMAVKRVDDKLSFYCDEENLNEQPIDPDVRLHLWFDALFLVAKIS